MGSENEKEAIPNKGWERERNARSATKWASKASFQAASCWICPCTWQRIERTQARGQEVAKALESG